MDKKHHPLDDLFRQGLKDLEISPTDEGRSGFMEKAGEELAKRSRSSGWLTGTAIILGILLTGVIIVYFNSSEKQVSKNSVETIKHNQSGPEAANIQTLNISAQGIDAKSTTTAAKKQNIPNQPEKSNSKSTSHDQFPNYTASTDIKNDISPVLNSDPPPPIHPFSSVILPDSATSPPSPPLLKERGPGGEADSAKYPAEVHPLKDAGHPPIPSSHKHEWNILAGIYYSPEWIFNTLDNNKYVNNFGLEGQFRFGPYSVRTGIGLSITRGFNEIVIETKPYLGGYNALDHITYHWDSKHYHLIPTYFTTWKEVYDTAIHQNYFTLEKEYTYLQIPLILGYDFFTEKWFSLGACVGPVMSLLLKTKELTSEYNAGKDQVISINNVTPDRIHLNWQAMGGVNASFHISGFITFELEPEIRYYFNSVYEKASPSAKPWSVGIRAAALVSF
jgi:hypothetical protein